ncbi:hypothetical protein ACIGHN_13490 [Acidovorax sp. NPDC077693]|uniref:hypothetical protein n=1 Tax=unclassified Acidovorax TaxID=2684926 RepID=UPI0037C8D864
MTRRPTNDELLAMRVREPRNGQRTTKVFVRLPYQGCALIHVDAAQFEAAQRDRPDLDALCAQACATVAEEVDFHATTTLAMQHRETAAIRARLDKALFRHMYEAASAIALCNDDGGDMQARWLAVAKHAGINPISYPFAIDNGRAAP